MRDLGDLHRKVEARLKHLGGRPLKRGEWDWARSEVDEIGEGLRWLRVYLPHLVDADWQEAETLYAEVQRLIGTSPPA